MKDHELQELMRIARELPDIYKRGRLRQVMGHQLIAEGIDEDKEGNHIKPKGKYTLPASDYNEHLLYLKSAFKKEGTIGVKRYIEHVLAQQRAQDKLDSGL